MHLSRIMAAAGGCHFQNAEMLPGAAPALLAAAAYYSCQQSFLSRASQALQWHGLAVLLISAPPFCRSERDGNMHIYM